MYTASKSSEPLCFTTTGGNKILRFGGEASDRAASFLPVQTASVRVIDVETIDVGGDIADVNPVDEALRIQIGVEHRRIRRDRTRMPPVTLPSWNSFTSVPSDALTMNSA